METKDGTEILDTLEEALITAAKNILTQSGFSITKDEARNLVGKIGARITFQSSLGKERTDEILLKNPAPKST